MERSRSLLVLTAAALLLPAQLRGEAVTVREPAYGLPHFFADTDLELARENGREIAKDRLGQLILLARVGRGTLSQAFGLLNPGVFDDDLEARREGYTSSELNAMWERLPERDRLLILEYCHGVNDTIEAIYAGELPEPIEVASLRSALLDVGHDLFGNAQNLSDQVDPHYRAPGGADPERPLAGFQFTPEMAMSIAVLQVRNFGLAGFGEASRLAELQALVAAHGQTAGTQIWSDLNFTNDPLAPVSVPDPATPGFGGPLAKATPSKQLARAARVFPRHAWEKAMERIEARRQARADRARRYAAWPQLGSYSWVISSAKSATGHPWLGGFPQTGIQTPSLMHFAENRSNEAIRGMGMEFAGGPFVLIGQTDTVAWTSTTAQLPVVDTFLEHVVSEDSDTLHYLDEGVPAPLLHRSEILRAVSDRTHVVWRAHERGGNGGSRPVLEFVGDTDGTASGGGDTTLEDDSPAFDAGFAGGHVALVDGFGAGQIRSIASATSDTLTLAQPWTLPPDPSSVYVAVRAGGEIMALSFDSAAWLEESTSVLGFSLLQRAENVLDVRAAARLMPSTHNFPTADNRPFNGFGTAASFGNIGYSSSGFSRIRQGGEDPRLPLDGAVPNPLVWRAGAVEAAGATTLTDTGAFSAVDLSAPPINARYDDPDQVSTEFIVCITSGSGYKQTRRIASNTADTLELEFPWGVVPTAGDTYEIQEILIMPETVNPAEGYTANWNNKAATLDPGSGFGRQHRVAFILERLAADNAWDRVKNRMLNDDVAGLDVDGRIGRFLIPRLREAVLAEGNGGVVEVDATLAALEAHDGRPFFGRHFIDPVTDTTSAGEISFLDRLVTDLAEAIYGDELAAVGVPGGSRALALVQHAIDSTASDVVGAYAQAYSGDYFNGLGWEVVARDTLAALTAATGGIPPDASRGESSYMHPLAEVPARDPAVLTFPPTPLGNRGIWEQIVEVGPELRGEFIFPLGQSGYIEGQLFGNDVTPDPHFTSLHPIWRDWRFVPMLPISADIARTGSPDSDGDGVLDGFERWYFGDTSPRPGDDADGDSLDLAGEFAAGSDPTDKDTDRDGLPDGADESPQDRLVPVPEPGEQAFRIAALVSALALGRWCYSVRWSSKPDAHS